MGVQPSTRLVSLDVFRGLTMAAMVIVNNPGDWGHVYAPLLHAEWNGCTPTDLIFPFFLFIVGVSLTLSRGTMGSPWKILRRAATIFLLGVFLSFYLRWDLSIVRIPGVLQRIAWCYLAVAFLFRATSPSTADPDLRFRKHGLVLTAWAVGLTLAYWATMMLVAAPGGVAGDLSPSGNLGAYIDRAVFGRHLWVQSKTWDPEGLLSTIPAIGTTLLGAVTGLWLATTRTGRQKARWMAGAGIVAMAIGYVWDVAFPINKSLWTSSYVWFTGGAALVSLALCYAVVDLRGWRRAFRPAVVLGLNAIALFVLSGMIAKTLGFIKLMGENGKTTSLLGYIYRSWFAPLANPYNASLLYALANLAVLWLILYWMDRKGIYLKA
jgi:predicted acyltransferase